LDAAKRNPGVVAPKSRITLRCIQAPSCIKRSFGLKSVPFVPILCHLYTLKSIGNTNKMINFKIPTITKSLFSTAIEVRISDINYGNHLGHDSLVSFFHEARVRFLRNNGYTELDIDGLGILVTQLVVNYINEAFYFDNLIIQLGIGGTTRTSVQLIYEAKIQETGKLVANGLTTITFYDYKQSKVARVPAKFLELANSYLDV
jgi:acyl-CoA thioesterase FadM